ncbi:hypothetical protein BSLG_001256 [Batrachochytrium salamandrivorans]|nr:hypothetical protein BSLG_001256 [Batrachochytrium salamandrivorans]
MDTSMPPYELPYELPYDPPVVASSDVAVLATGAPKAEEANAPFNEDLCAEAIPPVSFPPGIAEVESLAVLGQLPGLRRRYHIVLCAQKCSAWTQIQPSLITDAPCYFDGKSIMCRTVPRFSAAAFLPNSKTRRDGMNWIVKITSNEYAIWTCRIILMIIAGVFAKMCSGCSGWMVRTMTVTPITIITTAAQSSHDLQSKYQRFYSQRNVYMSAFTLFMILFLDMYRITQLELDVSATKQSPPVPIPLVPIASKTASTSATATSATPSAMKSKDGVATVNKPKAE